MYEEYKNKVRQRQHHHDEEQSKSVEDIVGTQSKDKNSLISKDERTSATFIEHTEAETNLIDTIDEIQRDLIANKNDDNVCIDELDTNELVDGHNIDWLYSEFEIVTEGADLDEIVDEEPQLYVEQEDIIRLDDTVETELNNDANGGTEEDESQSMNPQISCDESMVRSIESENSKTATNVMGLVVEIQSEPKKDLQGLEKEVDTEEINLDSSHNKVLYFIGENGIIEIDLTKYKLLRMQEHHVPVNVEALVNVEAPVNVEASVNVENNSVQYGNSASLPSTSNELQGISSPDSLQNHRGVSMTEFTSKHCMQIIILKISIEYF